MTTSQFAAIADLDNGQMAWDSNLDRLTYNANTLEDPRIEVCASLSDLQDLETDAIYGEMYFQGNDIETTISVAGTPVKIDATYIAGSLQEFTHSNGALTYTGTVTRPVKVTVVDTTTYTGFTGNVSIYVALNGAVIMKSKQTDFIGGITPAPQSAPVLHCQLYWRNIQWCRLYCGW